MYVTSHSGQLSLLSSAGREISTIQGAVAVLCGWEGNRSSYVTLAMHQSLCGIILWAQWPTEGDEHPAYIPLRRMAPFPYCQKSKTAVMNGEIDRTLHS